MPAVPLQTWGAWHSLTLSLTGCSYDLFLTPDPPLVLHCFPVFLVFSEGPTLETILWTTGYPSLYVTSLGHSHENAAQVQRAMFELCTACWENVLLNAEHTHCLG